MSVRLEFFFDCSSPWTYLAFHRIQSIAAETDTPILWRPILVGGVFNAINQGVYTERAKIGGKGKVAGLDLAKNVFFLRF